MFDFLGLFHSRSQVHIFWVTFFVYAHVWMNEGARGAPSTLMGISSLRLCLFGQTDGIDELDQTDTVFGLQLCSVPFEMS